MTDLDKVQILIVATILATLYAEKQLAIMRPIGCIYGCGLIVATLGIGFAIMSIIILWSRAAGG